MGKWHSFSFASSDTSAHIEKLLTVFLASVMKCSSVTYSQCSLLALGNLFPSPCVPSSLAAIPSPLITCNSLVGRGPSQGGDVCTSQYKPIHPRPTLQTTFMGVSHSKPLFSWPVSLIARFQTKKGNPVSRGH